MQSRIQPLPVDQLPLYGRLTHWLARRFMPSLQIPVRIKSKAPLLMFGIVFLWYLNKPNRKDDKLLHEYHNSRWG